MKFVNRKKEMDILIKSKELSKKKIYSLSMYGLRRVGKTRLVLEFLSDEDVYFFVNKQKDSYSLLKEYESVLRIRDILSKYEVVNDWDSFFEILFERYKGVAVFDEFQNFSFVAPEVYGIIQKNIDIHENGKGLMLIFMGSTIGMIRKLFEDMKEPLYGRIKRNMNIEPFKFKEVIELCNELRIKDIEEVVKIYSVFGGFPRYYVLMEDLSQEKRSFSGIMDEFFLNKEALLENEVMSILSIEFGHRKGMYYNILSAIASGENTISKIASYLNVKETSISRHITELKDYFGFIDYETQVVGKKRLLYVKHPLIEFWFDLFFKDMSIYTSRDLVFMNKVKNKINVFVSRRFEFLVREFLQEKYDFRFGRQWGKIPKAEKGKNVYEIDVLSINEERKELMAVEVKWKDLGLREVKEIVKDLEGKVRYVDWFNSERRERIGIFARKMDKRANEWLKEKGYLGWNLDSFI